MKSWSHRAIALAAPALVAAGCNALIGNDVHELAGGAPDDATAAGDASDSGTGGRDAPAAPDAADASTSPADASTSPDAAADASSPSDSGPGQDAADADAPATADAPNDGPCAPGSMQACVPVPPGWQPVALTQTTCPPGYGTPQTYFTSASAGDYSCSCGCSGTQSCSGTVTLNQFAADAGTPCTGTATTRALSITPACAPGGYGYIVNGDGYTISNVAYGPAPACTAMPTVTATPPVVSKTIVVCGAETNCPTGACLSPAETAAMCVAAPGRATCPAGFPTATVMAAMYDDTRSCGACACGSTLTCALTGVLLANDGTCPMSGNYLMTANTSRCSPGPSDYPLNAIEGLTNVSGSGTCAPTSPSQPAGGVALNAATTITVCCP